MFMPWALGDEKGLRAVALLLVLAAGRRRLEGDIRRLAAAIRLFAGGQRVARLAAVAGLGGGIGIPCSLAASLPAATAPAAALLLRPAAALRGALRLLAVRRAGDETAGGEGGDVGDRLGVVGHWGDGRAARLLALAAASAAFLAACRGGVGPSRRRPAAGLTGGRRLFLGHPLLVLEFILEVLFLP